jgi:hypothetical protein
MEKDKMIAPERLEEFAPIKFLGKSANSNTPIVLKIDIVQYNELISILKRIAVALEKKK